MANAKSLRYPWRYFHRGNPREATVGLRNRNSLASVIAQQNCLCLWDYLYIFQVSFVATFPDRGIWFFHCCDDSLVVAGFAGDFLRREWAYENVLRQNKPCFEIRRCYKMISILSQLISHDIVSVCNPCGGTESHYLVSTQSSQLLAQSLLHYLTVLIV